MKFNKILNLSGNVLAIAGIVFLILRFKKYSLELSEISFPPFLLLMLFCIVCISGMSVLLLVLAWKKLLCVVGVRSTFKRTIVIYGVSQLSKYIPGNVFQFAGRQLIAMRYGMNARAVAKSMGIELLLLVFSGCIFSALMLPHFIEVIGQGLSVALFLSLILIAASTFFYSINVFCALLCQCLYLTFSGISFYAILYFLDQNSVADFSSFIIITTGFVVAWLIGLVTPGAPAGIGVREAVLMVLLAHLPQSEVIAAALISRIVTLLGDVLFFFGSILLKKGEQ